MPTASSFSIRPSTTSAEPVRVLLVDDNEGMLARATAVLTPGCLVVGRVRDALDAIGVAGTLRPDVIVLDISMPNMSGFELAASLRSAGSTAVLVYLTVHEDEAFISAAKAAGGLGYVVKRRLTSDLVTAVQEACAGRTFVSACAGRSSGSTHEAPHANEDAKSAVEADTRTGGDRTKERV